MTELKDLYSERGLAQERSTQAAATERDHAIQMRDDACETVSNKSAGPATPKPAADGKKRRSGQFLDSLIDYTEKKDEAKTELEKERLAFEKEKLASEKQRLEVDAETRKEELQ